MLGCFPAAGRTRIMYQTMCDCEAGSQLLLAVI
jgi:hypothetical protein